jgi:hypothetical protein
MSKTQFTVSQLGKPCTNYKWDEETKTFSSPESYLVIDFGNINGITFNTGSGCTFNTGDDCTFNTGSGCTFDTGDDCTFNTGSGCTFDTGGDCTFTTGDNCVGIRFDVKGIIEIPAHTTIKYNGYKLAGYTKVEPVKQKVTLELTDEQLEQIKKIIGN